MLVLPYCLHHRPLANCAGRAVNPPINAPLKVATVFLQLAAALVAVSCTLALLQYVGRAAASPPVQLEKGACQQTAAVQHARLMRHNCP